MGEIAIIPARGGSKRIPRKNLRKLGGIPLLVRTITCLQKAQLFDLIVVSTEDPEIAELAVNSGAICPFLRPSDLADDHTPTASVVLHAIMEVEFLGHNVTDVCVAYPSLGLLTRNDFDEARNVIKNGKAQHVVTATRENSNVCRAWTKDVDGLARLLMPQYYLNRSQDLPEIFLDAGQFYWSTKEAWATLEKGGIPRVYLHELNSDLCQDIDTEGDWIIAENKILKFERM